MFFLDLLKHQFCIVCSPVCYPFCCSSSNKNLVFHGTLFLVFRLLLIVPVILQIFLYSMNIGSFVVFLVSIIIVLLYIGLIVFSFTRYKTMYDIYIENENSILNDSMSKDDQYLDVKVPNSNYHL